MIQKWLTIDQKESINLKIFSATMFRRKHPVQKKEGNFVVIDSPGWVNIIPITKDNEVVLVEQYRHGSDSITLEIPGGLIDPGEDPRTAAERECREETGFASDSKSELLCEILPNPAFMNNTCYSFLWQNCTKKFDQQLDGNEDIKVITVPISEIRHFITSGKINHSLVLNAFLHYYLQYQNL